MIGIEIILHEMDGMKSVRSVAVADTFEIKDGYSQKELFALYQKARAKFGITKFSEEQKETK